MTPVEIEIVRARISPFYPDKWEQNLWFGLAHAQLEGKRPKDCEFSDVIALVERMEGGEFI